MYLGDCVPYKKVKMNLRMRHFSIGKRLLKTIMTVARSRAEEKVEYTRNLKTVLAASESSEVRLVSWLVPGLGSEVSKALGL